MQPTSLLRPPMRRGVRPRGFIRDSVPAGAWGGDVCAFLLRIAMNRKGRAAGALLLVAQVLGGCASFSADGGYGAVASTVRERIDKDAVWVRSDKEADSVRANVRKLLEKPLTVDDAVQIALLNNKGLQATYAELGIAEADLVQAGRLRNPKFAYLHVHGGAEVRIERALTFDFMQLITMPMATRLERRRFEATQLRVAIETLQVAIRTRKAYINAVSARQIASYMEDVKASAEAGAEIARRMAGVGNWSKLNQAREHAFYAEATARLARAKQDSVAQREQLTRLLGLSGEDARFQLPDRLPDLPISASSLRDIEELALTRRLDIRAMRRDMEGLASSLGLTKATRFVNVLELGPSESREPGSPVMRGYEISIELPIFDWGGARVAKAEAIYMQAFNRAAQLAVNARSEVRESYAAYLTAYDLARHYRDEVVPLRKQISEENLLRYNGMLISVFELLADSREQVASINSYIEALRDHWLADADLQRAFVGDVDSAAASDTRPQNFVPKDRPSAER